MAKASITKETWRGHQCQDLLSLLSSPNSFFAVSKLSSIAHRWPSTATSVSIVVPAGHQVVKKARSSSAMRRRISRPRVHKPLQPLDVRKVLGYRTSGDWHRLTLLRFLSEFTSLHEHLSRLTMRECEPAHILLKLFYCRERVLKQFSSLTYLNSNRPFIGMQMHRCHHNHLPMSSSRCGRPNRLPTSGSNSSF